MTGWARHRRAPPERSGAMGPRERRRGGSAGAKPPGSSEDARMKTARLEAFSDAVIAIIMTIMVLGLRVPHETGVAALQPLFPVFLSYVLSFVYLGIYWNNHHH